MSLLIKNLAAGAIPTSADAVLTGSTSKSTLIKNISLVNTGAATVTVNLWLELAQGAIQAQQRHIAPKNLQIGPNAQVVLNEEITLAFTNGGPSPGTAIPDRLLAQVSAGGTVDYVINGLERDI